MNSKAPLKQVLSSKPSIALLVVALLCVHLLLGVGSIRHKSNTFDELIHITGGYSHWKQHDYRINAENGKIQETWATLPLLFMDIVPPDIESKTVLRDFVYNPKNPTDRMLFWSRFMVLLMSAVLGVVVFLWSRKIFGTGPGLFSLVLYCLSPTMLAHARLVNSDLAGTLFFITALWALHRLLSKSGVQSMILAGLAFGCLMAAKMSFMVIFPVAFVLFVMEWWAAPSKEERKARGLRILAIIPAVVVLGILTVWAFYEFRFYAAPGDGLTLVAGNPVSGWWVFLLKTKLLPESFIMGLWDVFHKLSLRDGFLNGSYSINGWWYFFPFCIAVKTPEPLLLVFALSAAGLIYHRHDEVIGKTRPLWVFVVLFTAIAMAMGINIGHRHILPIYPALFILAGALPYFWGKRFWAKCLMALCVAVLAVQTLWIYPDYLSYFNLVSGGPENGYKRLVDSSLDWGQDLPALKKWQDNLDETTLPVYLSYFGSALPEHFGIHAIRIAPTNLRETGIPALNPGWYCISATYLRQLYTGVLGPWCQPLEDKYQYLNNIVKDLRLESVAHPTRPQASVMIKYKRARFARLCHVLSRRKPDAMAGYSICIYRVGEAELRKSLDEPMTGLPKTRMVKGAGSYTLF